MSKLETGVETRLLDDVRWLPRGVPTWKMVDAEHADSVASGVLRIGTLASYSVLENGRSDDAEGKLFVDTGHLNVPDTNDPELVRRALRAGVEMAPGAKGLVIHNNLIIDYLVPMWSFCMAEKGCDFDWTPDKPKAIFEIKDPYALTVAIARSIRDKLREVPPPGHVEYQPVAVGLEEGLDRRVSPFIKAPIFAPEREVRIIFNPKIEIEDTIAPFFTPPDPTIRDLLRRVK